MDKFLKFMHKWGAVIIILLMVFGLIGQCSTKKSVRSLNKQYKEYVANEQKEDSVLNEELKKLDHKLDSTLISNNAVVTTNKATSSAINQKQQQVVVKVVPQK